MAKKRTTLPTDPLAEILAAWRLWLLGALLGAVLAWGAYQLWPPAYRARATVVVDANLEESWQYFPDRDLFQFLYREAKRLEEYAWSDEVLAVVAEHVPGYSVQQLRRGVLSISHPSDGGWHFIAQGQDAAQSQALASSWAQAFVSAAQAATLASYDLEAARAHLSAQLAANPQPEPQVMYPVMSEMELLWEHNRGISMYTELYVSQAAELPVERRVSVSSYLFVGSLVGALAAPLYVLLIPTRLRRAD